MADKKEQKTYYLGTGRRKTSVARVRLCEGKGEMVINGRSLEAYFTEEKDRALVLGPLQVTDLLNRVDVIVSVKGGGITGQSGAISLGIARALKAMFSGPDERVSRTFNNTTVVRSKRIDKATATPAATDTPASPEETTDSGTTGMVKKLRDSGYLTRDSRMKERKKYGLRGARRGTQFSKR
jgi:small subunit ribosomal protein S9